MTDCVMIFQVIDTKFSSQALFKVLVDDRDCYRICGYEFILFFRYGLIIIGNPKVLSRVSCSRSLIYFSILLAKFHSIFIFVSFMKDLQIHK